MFNQRVPFIIWTAGDLAAWCMMGTARQVVRPDAVCEFAQSQLDLNFMQTGPSSATQPDHKTQNS